MDKYKKITDLGLETLEFDFDHIQYVRAEDLLKVLDSGVEVSSYGLSTWTSVSYPSDTHSGLVIGIKELKPKQVTITRADLYDALNSVRKNTGHVWSYDTLAEKLGL